jgi:hypothetical protein
MEEINDWDKWLSDKEEDFKSKGYRKYFQNWEREDFAYWKPFYNGETKLFQVGILFYDFRKYLHSDPNANRIGTTYKCHLLSENSRIDLTVCKDITLDEFEVMAKTFYLNMNQFNKE